MTTARHRSYSLSPARIGWAAQWKPAALGPWDIMLAAYAMVVMSLVRAFDYSTGTEAENPSSNLTAVEAAAPLWGWALAFILFGTLLAVGVSLKRHLLVWAGHAALAVVYTGLLAGMVVSVLPHPWFDGIRAASALLLPCAMHWILAFRTGPNPIESGSATAVILSADDQGE